MFLGPRVIDADLGSSGLAPLRVAPQGHGGAIEVVGAFLDNIVRRYMGIKLPHEAFGQLGARPGFDPSHTFAHPQRRLVNQLAFLFLGLHRHCGIFPVGRTRLVRA